MKCSSRQRVVAPRKDKHFKSQQLECWLQISTNTMWGNLTGNFCASARRVVAFHLDHRDSPRVKDEGEAPSVLH